MAVLIVTLACSASTLPAQPRLAAETARLDSYATTPDGRLIVAALVAQHLKVHRNHLILERKETGRPYSAIFIETLREKAQDDHAILAAISELNRQIDRQLSSLSRSSSQEGEPGLRGVAFLSTTVDHNSAATFYTATPELGIEASRGSLVVGLPLYFNDISTRSVSGVGDVYTQGQLWARVRGFDFNPVLTVGFPTGDSARGLGAGKLTADGAVTVARPLNRRLRPFVTVGLANYVFNNVGYQRPYISTGGASHFAGGLTVGAGRLISLGVAGFAVEPFGDQQMTSREVMEDASRASPQIPPGMGHNSGGMPQMGQMPVLSPGMAPSSPPFLVASHATVGASDLRDGGLNTWVSFALHPTVSLQIGVARSLAFDLTTVRIGMGFNLRRIVFPKAWR